jgi:hypothetical protein
MPCVAIDTRCDGTVWHSAKGRVTLGRMRRETGTTIRLDPVERRQLTELAAAVDRTPSDLLRTLMKREHRKVFGAGGPVTASPPL